jgi:restriction system protein
MNEEDVPVRNNDMAIEALIKHWRAQHGYHVHMVYATDSVIFTDSAFAGAVITSQPPPPGPDELLPILMTQTLIIPESKDAEGLLIREVTIAWQEIVKLIIENRSLMYQIDSRKWEEIIAGSYEAAGYKVKLTPRSGDFGRDVIAYREGFGALRFIESVKRYTPGNEVTADDVRALLGVLLSDQKATKGIVSTTWEFAPKIMEDPFIKPNIPYRLELVNGSSLIERFKAWGKID